MRSFFLYLSLVLSLSFFVACGGSSNSNNGNNSNNSSPPPPPSGANGSGSGSSGSGSGSGGSGSSGSGGASSSSVSYVYTASASTIFGYGVSSNGSLTAVSGSPFSASTAQGANIVTNGANLYAIAEGGTNLDIFSINKSSGSLTPASGTSAVTGGPSPAQALALDHTGTSLYVGIGLTDQNGGINAFMVGSDSSAKQFQFLSTGATSFPPLVFSPNNQNAYSNTCFFRDEGVFGFTRASDGTLKPLSLGPVTEPTVTGAAFCPGALAVSAKGYLAVVWVRDFMCCGSSENHVFLMTYKINGDGTLTAVSGSQQQTASTADASSANTVAANFDPSGTVLAMTGNGGIQTYSLNGNGMLTPAGSPQNAGVKFQKVAWDNSNHVFATDSSQLYVFNSSSGMLSPASGSPYAGGQAVTVLPLQ
jgi:6-phosphogluconolactonase (cycloisomerase 2 family)